MTEASGNDLDQEVRSACDAGDYDRAATLVIKRYGAEILGFLVTRLRDEVAAGDVFSEFAERFWKGLPGFQWRSSVRTWAYTIARHAANTHLADGRRKVERNLPLSQLSRVSRMAEKIRSRTMPHLRTEIKSKTRLLRERLKPDDRLLLSLRVDRQLSWRELAVIMSYDGAEKDEEQLRREEARLRKRYQLVKDQLRTMMKSEGMIE